LQTGNFRIDGNGNVASLTVGGNGTMASLTVTGLTTQGGLLFTSNAGGAVAQKAGQLVWDNTTNRLGIGNAAPSVALHVTGDLRATGLNKTGGILFTSGTTGLVEQDDAQLFWNSTNNRLGIGTATPAASLDVLTDFKLGTNGTKLGNIMKTTTPVAATSIAARSGSNVVCTLVLPAGVLLKADDNIILNPTANLPAGVSIGWARVTSTTNRQITIGLVNATTATVNVAAQTYYVTIIQL
jgi:hypothetical protein